MSSSCYQTKTQMNCKRCTTQGPNCCKLSKQYHIIHRLNQLNNGWYCTLHIGYYQYHCKFYNWYRNLSKCFHLNISHHYKKYRYFWHCKFYRQHHINHKYKMLIIIIHNNWMGNQLNTNHYTNNAKLNRQCKLYQSYRLNNPRDIYHRYKQLLISYSILLGKNSNKSN